MEKYGTTNFQTLSGLLLEKAEELNMEIKNFQTNIEGELVDYIQSIHDSPNSWIIINPGAFTHTSIALRDALNSLSRQSKVIEVHISNIQERENFRKYNLISEFCEISIIGEGIEGYFQALDYINDN